MPEPKDSAVENLGRAIGICFMKVGVVFISCDSKGFTDAMNGYLVCNGPDYDIWVQSLASYLQDLVPHVGGGIKAYWANLLASCSCGFSEY